MYCIPTYVMWMMALRPLRQLLPSLYWKIEGTLFHWLLGQVAAWSWTAGYEIVESGDDINVCLDSRTLILANHQSTADVPILMGAWNPRQTVLPNIMWIMDRLFKYTNFGVVSVLHGDFFIASGRDRREQSLLELTEHLKNIYIKLNRKFVILFPEGGFLHKRRDASHRFAKKNNLPLLENVSLPRAGALRVIMDEVGPYREVKKLDKAIVANNVVAEDRIEWILDITIAYENRDPLNLKNIVYGDREPCTTHLYYRLYKSTEIPVEHEAMTNWLYERWYEKEKMLEDFYKNGHFSKVGPDGVQRSAVLRPVKQDNLKIFILHLFFITSTVIHAHIAWYAYQNITAFIW